MTDQTAEVGSPDTDHARRRSPTAPQLSGRVRSALEVAVVFLGCLALLVNHPTNGRVWHNFWAEDGTRFLGCRLQSGLSCFHVTYQGYQQLAPRIVMQFVPYFPLHDWALVTALSALAGDALSLVIVYRTSAWLVESRITRALLVFVVAAAAAAHWEAAGNLANLHWWLLVSAMFAGADRLGSDAVAPAALRIAWCVVACLSEGLAPVIVVAYLVGIVLRRLRRGAWNAIDLVGGGLIVVAAVLQLASYLQSPRIRPPGTPQSVSDALRDYRIWLLDRGWAGQRHASDVLGHVVVIAVVVLLVGGIVLAVLRRHSAGVRWLPIAGGVALGVGSIADLALSVIANNSFSPRYLLAPFALLLTGAFIVLANLYVGFRWTPFVPPIVVAGILAAILIIGPWAPLVSHAPTSWHSVSAAVQRRCDAGATTPQILTFAPNPGWRIAVTCDQLGVH